MSSGNVGRSERNNAERVKSRTVLIEETMLVGHVAAGFVAKRVEPAASLGTLVMAAMVADLLRPGFTISGIEYVNFGPGMGAGTCFEPVNIPMSHSLVMDAVWAELFSAARNPRTAPIGSVILFSLFWWLGLTG